MIVVASNDNESSRVTLPGFSICEPVPVIRGPTRFLTMAEVAVASPQTSFGVRLSRIYFSPDKRTPKDVCGEAKVAEVEDGVVIIDCVAIVYEEGEGGEHYRNKNKFRCRVSRIEKRLVK